MTRRNVTFAFHHMDEYVARTDAWQTRWGMRLLGKYVHVDVQFEDGMTTTIHRDGTITYEPRALSNPCKQLLMVNVSAEEYASMQAFAYNAHRNLIGFNTSGFHRCAFPLIWRRCDDRQYFCSEYALRLLQAAGQYQHIDPGRMHPTRLRDLLMVNKALPTVNKWALQNSQISFDALLAPRGGYGRLQ
jgi:hypothetical protein